MALTTRLRSVLSDARERAGRDGAGMASGDSTRAGEPTEEPTAGLFECPACETVYIAEEKSTCGSCDEPVEEVSATLSRE